MTQRLRKVVFLGNCQANALAAVYETHLGVPRGDQVAFADAQNVLTDARTAACALSEADVVVSQVFDFPTKLKAEDLPPQCVIYRVPSVVAGFYWPFASQPHIRTPKDLAEPPYPAQLGDRFLNGLIAKNVAPQAALEQYLELDVPRVANLDRLLELSLERQRKRDAEAQMDLATTIEGIFRTTHAFLTPDHPNLEIFSLLARQVFSMLGASRAEVDEVLSMQLRTPFPNAALPIHPRLAEHFGLGFAGAETRYAYFDEGAFTFAEYVIRYMRYEWNADLREGIHGKDFSPEQRVTLLRKGLEGSPGSTVGWRALGEAYLNLSLADQARDAAQKAFATDPNDAEVWRLFCQVEIARGRLTHAGEICGEAISRFPNVLSLRYVMTHIAQLTGDIDCAVASACEAARLRRGVAAEQEFFERTIDWANRRKGDLRATPGRPRADPRVSVYAKAEALERAGNADEAVRVLERLCEEHPADAQARARIGNLCLRKGEPEAAARYFRAAIALDSDAPAFWNGLAMSLFDTQRYDECEAIIRPLAARGVHSAHIYATLARLQAHRGEFAEAESSLRTAIGIDPSLSGLYNALADVFWRTGRQAEAVELLDKLAREGVEDAHLLARLGAFEARRGNLSRSQELLNKAVALDRTRPEFKLLLAEVLIAGTQFAHAARVISELDAAQQLVVETKVLRARILESATR